MSFNAEVFSPYERDCQRRVKSSEADDEQYPLVYCKKWLRKMNETCSTTPLIGILVYVPPEDINAHVIRDQCPWKGGGNSVNIVMLTCE